MPAERWTNPSSNAGSPAGGKRAIGDRSDIDRVRDASDIVRIIGEHISLRPKGREYVGLCPFHDDRTPSMTVVPHKQFYKCFSCGASGDVFTFVQKFLRMEFRESLEFLAERAGVQLTPLRQQSLAERGDGPAITKKDLLAANNAAAAFFAGVMKHETHGATGRQVLVSRGVSEEMIKEFRLGIAPDRWDGLIMTLGSKFGKDVLAQAGLLKQREQGGYYDAFRNRVMFPITDRTGRVIAFGARKINPDDEPKYLNSPETPVFYKSKTLYGLDLALRTIQQEKTALICEGYMDVIACHQAGFRNAIATLGTALTPEHAKELRLACDRILLLFDGDEAGQRAADRAAEVFFSQPVDVAIVSLNKFTDAKDPDELLKRDGGPEVFRKALAGAIDLLDFRFQRVAERLEGAGLAARSKAMVAEIERLVELGLANVEPIRKALIEKRLAQIAGVPEAIVRASVPAGRAARPNSYNNDAPTPVVIGANQQLTLEEHLLGCLLCDGALWTTLSERDKDIIAPVSFESDIIKRVAQSIHDLGEDGELPHMQSVLSQLEADDDARSAAIALMSRVDEQSGHDQNRVHALWRACMSRARGDAMLRSSQAGLPEPKSVGDASAAAVERLKLLNSVQQTLGPDRRKVPRPG